jgi:hypothetical protein
VQKGVSEANELAGAPITPSTNTSTNPEKQVRGLPGVPSHVARQPFLDPIGIAEEAHRAIPDEHFDR